MQFFVTKTEGGIWEAVTQLQYDEHMTARDIAAGCVSEGYVVAPDGTKCPLPGSAVFDFILDAKGLPAFRRIPEEPIA